MMPIPITTVSGLLVDSSNQPRAGAVVLFEAVLESETVAAADHSALILYETKRRVTGADGRLPPTDIVSSSAAGVTIPWRVSVRARGESESWEFVALEGAMDLADIPQLPATTEPVARWVAFRDVVVDAAARAEAAAAEAEAIVTGANPDETPSLTILFENGLI